MKTEFWVSFNYGAMQLVFVKTFDLQFTPFIGLIILEESEESGNRIELVNNSYCNTDIIYKPDSGEFEVDVRNHWTRPVTDEEVDYQIANFAKFGWERHDTTNIKELKELMLRNYKGL
jgi:hypothetical protein